MSPRDRRLMTDLRQMEALASDGLVTFRTEGSPAETYHIMFTGSGLALDAEHRLVLRNLHRCDVYLHREYPRRPPIVTWLTPIFHPNILGPDRNGGVCIGSWSASESLADLMVRIRRLVIYESFNLTDGLDANASRWLLDSGIQPGADLGALIGRVVTEPVIAARGSVSA